MIGFLRRHEINPDGFTLKEAGALIGEMKRRWDNELCSFPQMKLLKRWYQPAEYQTMKFKEAIALITRVKQNGWRRVELTSTSTAPIQQKVEDTDEVPF